jgi:hypothetical protein
LGELPTGTVTFLFTDIEGSTRLWEDHLEAMKGSLARHGPRSSPAYASGSGVRPWVTAEAEAR